MILNLRKRQHRDRPRYGEVYGHPADLNRTRWLYIGRSRNSELRDAQHATNAPWYDLSPGMVRLWSGYCTDAMLDDLEKAAIRQHLPIYNVLHNEDNPDRIPPYEAWRCRQARDEAFGRPISYPPTRSGPGRRRITRRRAFRLPRLKFRFRRARRKASGVLSWALVLVGVYIAWVMAKTMAGVL